MFEFYSLYSRIQKETFLTLPTVANRCSPITVLPFDMAPITLRMQIMSLLLHYYWSAPCHELWYCTSLLLQLYFPCQYFLVLLNKVKFDQKKVRYSNQDEIFTC